jgi:hypothetical protein
MNETKHLEKQLQSWMPRQPSAEIRDRLFKKSEKRANFSVAHWLAPMAACFLAVLALFGLGHRDLGESDGDSALIFASSNSLRRFSLDAVETNLEPTENSFHPASFDWTNRQVSSSSNGSLQLAQTNLLMR